MSLFKAGSKVPFSLWTLWQSSACKAICGECGDGPVFWMSNSWQMGTFVKVKCCTEVRFRWEFLNACSQFVYTFLQTSRSLQMWLWSIVHTETWVSGKIQCIPMSFLWELGILPEWEGSAFVLLCYWASQGHCVELSSVCLAQDAWLKRCAGAGVSLLRHDPLLGRTAWINHQTVPVTFAAFWEGFHVLSAEINKNLLLISVLCA